MTTILTTQSSIPALVGGACIGLSAFWNFVLDGRVTGVNGELQSAVHGSSRSLLFLSGLTAGGYLLSRTPISPFTPGFDPLIVLSPTRVALACALVGFGASLSNGCTSGHGVCGVARRSPRSLAAVVTFMSTAMITASSLKSSSAIPPSPPVTLLSPWIGPLVLMSVMPGVLAALYKRTGSALARTLGHVSRGLLFAAGLMVSGMAHPGNTLRFLDVVTRGWEPTVAAVFVGALPVAYAGYRRVTAAAATPVLAEKHALPTRTDIDPTLLAGAAVFGVGWGIAGVCPGPALTYLGAVTSVASVAVLGAIVSGGFAGRSVARWLTRKS